MGIDLRRDETRGEDAKRILNDPLYKESWMAMRENIIAKLENGELKPEERQRWNDMLIIHGKAKKYLEQVVMTGEMAGMEVERQRTMTERMQQFLRPAA